VSTILVTGAAGFIGFHLSQRLLARGDTVLGLDNLNDYYDVRLKEDRLAQLQGLPGFEFHRLDLADQDGIARLFSERKPVMVVNLAFSNSMAHERSILRIRRSFADAVVVVESEDPGNRIVFACKGAMRLPERALPSRPEDLRLHYAVNLSRTRRCIQDELAAAS